MNILHVTTDIGETDVLRREFNAVDPNLRVECAGTPSEAIARLEAGTSHYDAILLELTQMNGEGLSLVSHIRTNNLPVGVVAITSAREDGPSREVLNGGADHCVVKGGEFLHRLPTVLAQAVERRTLEARLRVMLETAPACLMRVAGDGTILAMNIAALEMVDAERPDQVVDQSWYERVVPGAQAACRHFIERAANGDRGSLECQLEGFSGTQRWVVMHAVCAPVDASGVPSALVAIRDLEKIRGLEAGLESGVEQYRQKLAGLEETLREVEAQNQQLLGGHDAERVEWQQQLAAAKTQEETVVEQLRAERAELERGTAAAAAQCQQLSADHAAERAEWQQQLAAGKAQEGTVVEQLRAERAELERGTAAAAAQCEQLSADHEAERAEWQQQLAAAKTQEGTVDEQLRTARDDLERGMEAAAAECQQLSADHAAERAEWQQQLAVGKAQEGTAVEQLRAERDELERTAKAAAAQCQQLSTDHAAERVEWQQQLAAGKAQEGTAVEQLRAERDELDRRSSPI